MARTRERAADLLVIGGGVGGCAAAMAAARNGLRVILTEETDWIGGQLTQQAVPPDEHPWGEQFGFTRSYRSFRNRVRDYYRRNYPLTGEAAQQPFLNPGNGLVGPLCHEPKAALAVLKEMMAPFQSGGRLTVLLRHKAVAAETGDGFVRSVLVKDRESGNDLLLHAPYLLDATELGDLLPMTGTEYRVGAESRRETGEPHAPEIARPDNQQAFTCCFAIDYREGEDHTLDKPEGYEFWREYLPEMTPSWPGRLLSLTGSHPFTLEPRTYLFDPIRESEEGLFGLWRYRRILDRRNFLPGSIPGDLCLVNWPMNDYWLGNLIDVTEAEAAEHLRRAKALSLSLLHWLQTEAPRRDGGTGWPGLRLRPDVVGTEDGLAKAPYIRESRRIQAEFTVLEQHIGTESRRKATGSAKEDVLAADFVDSVGIGSYRIDLHPSSGGDNYIDISSLPFQIPLGALIPVRMENLLPACKNIGVTHLTNGCYRLHPVEWNIGESAGLIAVHCLENGITPRDLLHSPERVTEFQKRLMAQGVEIRWPKLRPL